MNIAFLNSIEKNTYGGMEEWIRLVADGLNCRGHKVTLIGRKDSLFLKRVNKTNADFNIVELNISGDFNPITISEIRRQLAENDIDILSVNFNKDVRIGGVAARLDNKVKIVWSLGLNITKNNIAHKIITPPLVDRVIVPSESLKKEVIRYGYINKSIVDVIPIGIPYKLFDRPDNKAHMDLRKKLKLPDNSLIAVTTGRFVEHKGHDVLIKAAPKIINQFDNIYFLFLGDGPLENILKEMINELNIENRFIFAGMLENIDMELSGSDIMLHPSRIEPFGIAILEGMRAGLPIVASRVGGIPEVVSEGSNAVLVEPDNPETVALAVIKLLSDTDKMEKFGKEGRHRFRSLFLQEIMIDKVEKSFKSFFPNDNCLCNSMEKNKK